MPSKKCNSYQLVDTKKEKLNFKPIDRHKKCKDLILCRRSEFSMDIFSPWTVIFVGQTKCNFFT